ncbi:MAG: acyl-[Bacteroidaceae bacterium]|nr:acyl-[acyl-carrier-protein] thioesterase [Bacteroidaceae bacterium]
MDSFSFHVEPFSEDLTGRLSWGVMGNTLLRVAEKAAIRHGFGFSTVHEQNAAWVLSRLLIEMERMPQSGEAFQVDTWVSRIYRQFTDRLYRISDAQGNTLGHAHSVWALINLDTRLPINLEEIDNPGFHAAMDTGTIPIDGFSRNKLRPQGSPQREIEVVQSDLDINGHVNSIRYMQMAIDSLYLAYGDALSPRTNIPTRVEMTYAAETFYGDKLSVFTEAVSAHDYHVLLTRADATPVVRAVAKFL